MGAKKHYISNKPKSSYAAKLHSAAAELSMRDRRMIFQMAHDAFVIAVNRKLGLANDRAADAVTAFNRVFDDIIAMIDSDGADDRDIEYTKHKVDTELARILGEHFVPWDVRYGK